MTALYLNRYAVPDETLLKWAGEMLEKDRPSNVVPIRKGRTA